ncbi:hypothetical protein DPMN_117528 [Dreissena polymorpha]|uniref:Uncharacterized protein n=1 Tax=Dreissena polymorpha TaxID=45954 RepID=A0A9D4QUZ9_DREPO|nr:hypothetical protein DPMN_117528 [Dreissena polymorpha]
MSPYDQSPTKYKDRPQTQLIKGRFKAPNTSRIQLIPGVQSVKRQENYTTSHDITSCSICQCLS